MKGKKIIFLFVSIFIVITVGGYFSIKYIKGKTFQNNVTEEYIPQEEITDAQLRQTIVTLYFKSKNTGEIATEARLVDANKLINNPYVQIINLLIEGPKNEKLQKVIPDGVKVNNAVLKGNCVVIDFSSEFLNYNNDENRKNDIINSVVNTLTELTEVNSIRIVIDGNENSNFNEEYVRV